MRPNGRGMIVVAAFSGTGVSNDKVVLDSHIVAVTYMRWAYETIFQCLSFNYRNTNTVSTFLTQIV